MKPTAFAYLRPATVEEAVALLAEQRGDAKILAGGQSLVPVLRFRLSYFDSLIDIGRLDALRGIELHEDGELHIGALTSQSEAERHPVALDRCPLLGEALRLVAHSAIRNCGTVGGSLAHADPAAELPAVAVALDATLVSRSVRGVRLHAAEEFFTSFFMTALDEDELLTEIRLPAPSSGAGSAILEIARRPGDFALAGVVARVRVAERRCEEARVVLFGVGACATRARDAEDSLIGTALSDRDLHEAARTATDRLDPPSDVRASAEYRRRAARVLCRRALARARDRAQGSATAVANAA